MCQGPPPSSPSSKFKIRCWAFDVRCSFFFASQSPLNCEQLSKPLQGHFKSKISSFCQYLSTVPFFYSHRRYSYKRFQDHVFPFSRQVHMTRLLSPESTSWHFLFSLFDCLALPLIKRGLLFLVNSAICCVSVQF